MENCCACVADAPPTPPFQVGSGEAHLALSRLARLASTAEATSHQLATQSEALIRQALSEPHRLGGWRQRRDVRFNHACTLALVGKEQVGGNLGGPSLGWPRSVGAATSVVMFAFILEGPLHVCWHQRGRLPTCRRRVSVGGWVLVGWVGGHPSAGYQAVQSTRRPSTRTPVIPGVLPNPLCILLNPLRFLPHATRLPPMSATQPRQDAAALVARLVDQGAFSVADLAEDSDLQGVRGGAWLAGVLARLREEALRRLSASGGGDGGANPTRAGDVAMDDAA